MLDPYAGGRSHFRILVNSERYCFHYNYVRHIIIIIIIIIVGGTR
jgi:hypothetical protein